MNKSEAVGGVYSAVDRLTNATHSVEQALGMLQERLAPVTLTPPPQAPQSVSDQPVPQKSHLALEIESRAYNIECVAKALRQLNDTLDI